MSPPDTRGRRRARFIGLLCVVALLLAVGLWYVIARPATKTITAYFTSATAVFQDNEVRVLGVRVGSITGIEPQGTRVKVEMRLDYPGLKLPADVRAAALSPSLVTGRYVQLAPAYTGGPELVDGAEIPIERTAVPYGIDDLARTASELSIALGPNGVNSTGAVSEALRVGAANLGGNGQAVNDTLRNLSELNTTLSGSREDLFGTIRALQQFVSMLAANDAEVREFNTRLADVARVLAEERDDLGAALHELSIALGEVAVFVEDNRSLLESNVDRLTDITAVLVEQRDALTELLDVAPLGLGNLDSAYNASSGTLDTRANLNELMTPPILLVCRLIEQNQVPPASVPEPIVQRCTDLAGVLGGTVPLPTAGEVIGALQAGRPLPVPGLALPVVEPPAVPAAPAAPDPNHPAPAPQPPPPAPNAPPADPPGPGLPLLGGGL